MCGKESHLVNADVDGAELKLCSSCSRYGVVKKEVSGFQNKKFFKKRFTKKDEPEFKLVNNYSNHIFIIMIPQRGPP